MDMKSCSLQRLVGTGFGFGPKPGNLTVMKSLGCSTRLFAQTFHSNAVSFMFISTY